MAKIEQKQVVVNGIKEKLESIDERLDKLLSWKDGEQEKPAKTWDKVRNTIITVVVTALVTYILAQLGLK